MQMNCKNEAYKISITVWKRIQTIKYHQNKLVFEKESILISDRS